MLLQGEDSHSLMLVPQNLPVKPVSQSHLNPPGDKFSGTGWFFLECKIRLLRFHGFSAKLHTYVFFKNVVDLFVFLKFVKNTNTTL